MASQNRDDVYERYGAMLYRQAMVYLKNPADAEDALQDVLERWMRKAPTFESLDHERRWLLRITINRCKDMLRFRFRRESVPLESIVERGAPDEDRALLKAVMALPMKYKTALHLYYYEGYSVEETAKILGASPSAVKMRLKRGREQLKMNMEDRHEA